MKNFFDKGYVTADIDPSLAMINTDVINIAFPDETFDFIYCSHVLEHVEEDEKALREMRRVLRVGGCAIFQVPITAEKTFRDPTIVDPQKRFEVFGDPGHVRRYGPDFSACLSDNSFQVETFRAEDLMEKKEAKRMGLAGSANQEVLFFCRR